MPVIITIGSRHFLVKSETAALAAMKALSDAVEVTQSYERKTYEEVYFPTKETHGAKINMAIINAKQLRRSDPSKGDDDSEDRPAPKQLEYDGKVFYTGNGDGK